MGSNHSVEVSEQETDSEEEDEDDHHHRRSSGAAEMSRQLTEEDNTMNPKISSNNNNNNININSNAMMMMMMKKVVQQEPEMVPCHASASPLSPQLSSLGTPRLGPSIKVWDPYNVLAPPPPPPPISSSAPATEVFLINHGECVLNLAPDLVPGRCPSAALTASGHRQSRALAVFLNSQGVRFSAVFSSPLDRSRSTALSVCQEMNFAEDQIQVSEALSEMSQGLWEGCHRSEIYSPEVLKFMESVQPDFSPPSGESLRQVEFRMVEFLNATLLGIPEKLRSEFDSHWQRPSPAPGLLRKRSGKSRLQFVTSTGDHETEDEISSPELNHRDRNGFSCIGVFSHSVPIKCLLAGILGCGPQVSNKLCVDDSSVTVLQHSLKTGWQIKKLNDTAHLRLL